MNTVVIIHRWGTDSAGDWIPWLKTELESRGVNVIAPDMPDTDSPSIDTWVPYLSQVAKDPDESFFFVGHSVGCQAIIRYLTTLPRGERIGGAAFVAGWTILTSLSDEHEENIARPWVETPIDWDDAASRTSSYVDIYSDDDPYVPVENADFLKRKLNAKLVLDRNRGHFTEGEDITQLPVLLDELLIIMGMPVETKFI